MGSHFWLSSKLDSTSLSSYAKSFNVTAKESLRQLSHTISTSTNWESLGDCALVFRDHDAGGCLAVCMQDDLKHTVEIQTQLNFLQKSIQQIQYLDIAKCESLAHSLAQKINLSLDPETLQKSRVVSIPRGGLFVSAMLSYILPIKHHQLQPFSDCDSPIILIDDCSISGFRLAQQLCGLKNKQIYFYTLVSPAQLRQAALAVQPRLRVFESAMDLNVYNNDSSGRMDARSNRYWQGQCDAICFPWGETQRFYPSDSENKQTTLWPVSPLQKNLKSSLLEQKIPFYAVTEAQDRAISTGQHILYYSKDNLTRIYNAESKQHYSLDGVGSAIWQSLLSHSTVDQTLEHLCSLFSVEKKRLEKDVKDLIAKFEHLEIIA